MLAKFFIDIIALLYGKGGNSQSIGIYIGCAIFMALSFGWKKNFWTYFLACN